jgi:hypothetical protein
MFVDMKRQEENEKRRIKEKVMADEKLHFGEARGVRKSIIRLGGSQALPARPADGAI